MSLSAYFIPDKLPKKPYCSSGKGCRTLIRTLKSALSYPQIQINSPTYTHWLIFDVDKEQAAYAWKDCGLPPPTWVTINPENGHAHIVYGLKTAVYTGENARIAPMRYLAVVYQAMAKKMGADKGYAGVLTHNPMHPQWRTWVVSQSNTLYELGELADYVDLPPYSDHFRPEKATAANQDDYALGRNCTVFEKLRVWAYEAIREYRSGRRTEWERAVLSKAQNLNDFSEPMSYNEVKQIAKSVSKWVWRMDKSVCVESAAKFSEKQRQRAKKATNQVEANKASVTVRRAANVDLISLAVEMYQQGFKRSEIAQKVGKSESTIKRWIVSFMAENAK